MLFLPEKIVSSFMKLFEPVGYNQEKHDSSKEKFSQNFNENLQKYL